LKKALSDSKPAVVLAAAHALQLLNDPAGFQVYYEVLTGERKSAEGLVGQQMETLKDGKKMAELGIEEGLGFIPFADIGFSAAIALSKDSTSLVRAAAARVLINDPDPRIGEALVRAASDKKWIVRASALLAIAKRGDPEFLNAIIPALSDKNGVVSCTAAAAVIRLTTVTELNKDVKGTSSAPGGESRSKQTQSEAPVTGIVDSNGFGQTPTNQATIKINRRKYEVHSENCSISWANSSFGDRFICSARQNGLRPQCKLWPIQDLLLGKGPNERPAPG
jgi:HEAT repeat protein